MKICLVLRFMYQHRFQVFIANTRRIVKTYFTVVVGMAINIGIGVLVGSIPLLGDAFDIAWKPNRRNYQLMQRHIGQPRRHAWKDWAFLAALVCAIAIVFAIPIVVFVWLLLWVNHHVVI